MMSKKGLLKFVKYTLIFSNAFGFILSIFLGLFGIAYPDKHFPLSYKGREMALCSLFCMLFTTIGYCGAQIHRRILLIIYGATNVIIVIIVVILWFLFRENSILGNKEISNMFITTLAITIAVMFLFSFILAFHIQTFKDNTHDSIVSQSQQLLQQTTAFLQQQQQYQLQQLHNNQQQQQSQQQQQQQQQPQQPQNNIASSTAPTSVPGFGSTSGSNSARAGSTVVQLQSHQHLTNTSAHPSTSGNTNQTRLQLVPSNNLPDQQQLLHQPAHVSNQPLKQVQPDKQALSGTTGNHQQLNLQCGAKVSGVQLPPPHLHQSSVAMITSPPPPPPPPQVPNPNNPQHFMRNQSSPLPGVGVPASSVYQTRAGISAPVQHHHHQSQQTSRAQGEQYQSKQVKQQIAPHNMIPPPPPSPPSMHHHYHHTIARDHHHSRLTQTGARVPSCPVQYCTFECDRTV